MLNTDFLVGRLLRAAIFSGLMLLAAAASRQPKLDSRQW
jgi:hypothetical protein